MTFLLTSLYYATINFFEILLIYCRWVIGIFQQYVEQCDTMVRADRRINR